MCAQSAEQLVASRCVPCEGGVAAHGVDEAKAQLENLEGWRLSDNAIRIRKRWIAKDFMAAIRFFNLVAEPSKASFKLRRFPSL